jgi:hypothetical protein
LAGITTDAHDLSLEEPLMRHALTTLVAAAGFLLHAAVHAACSAASGEQTAVLVELYTSEGCDSCPPADRWLSSLRQMHPRSRVVPLSLHVDYWDYIGWKDPWAKQQFTRRQYLLAKTRRSTIVYTPQVLVQGRDFRQWGTPAFDAAVAQLTARPARARLRLTLEPPGRETLRATVEAQLLDSAPKAQAALYLASYEDKLASAVSAGENRGKTLNHDHVVLEWVGPIELGAASRVVETRSLALLPKAVARNSGVVAFVQDRSNSEVLQALMLPVCAS